MSTDLKDSVRKIPIPGRGGDNSRSKPYIFLSLDLKNSTQYKHESTYWPLLITRFFEITVSEVPSSIAGMSVWKTRGDEVLFYKRVESFDDLINSTDSFLRVRNTIADLLHNEHTDARDKDVDIKATAWIALVKKVDLSLNQDKYADESNRKELTKKNISVLVGYKGLPQQLEFLGSEIDTGFRLTTWAIPQALTISAELAYLLSKHDATVYKERCRLVGHKKLKGSWNGRYYPVVWYRDSWSNAAELFNYDDPMESDLVNNLVNNEHRYEAGFDGNQNGVERALEAVDKLKGAERFLEKVKDGDDTDQLKDEQEVFALEIHSVAVCFDHDGKVMLARRNEKPGKMYRGVWEFGCAQLDPHDDFFDAMERHYKKDFGAKLHFFSKNPIGVYFIQEKKVPGIIFAAQVENPEYILENYDRTKHEKVQFYAMSDINFETEDCVPDFHATLEKAKKLYKAACRDE